MEPISAVQSLIDRTNRDLGDWNDFFEHARAVWRGFQYWVAAGNTFRAVNTATAKEFTEKDLSGLSQYYITEHLASFAFQRYLSVFEVFVFGLLRLLLVRNPGHLSKKDVKFGNIVRKPDLATVIEEVIDHELNEIRYDKPREWFEFMNRVEKLGCPKDDEIECIAEMKATRDVLEHNAGLATKVYVSKAAKKARFEDGDFVELPDAYLRDSWALLKSVCNDLASAAIKIMSVK